MSCALNCSSDRLLTDLSVSEMIKVEVLSLSEIRLVPLITPSL